MDASSPQRPHPWQKEPAFISTPATIVLTRLLPDATRLRLEACDVDDTTAQITLRVQSTQTRAPCPLCATPARRIHSDYGRTLADLPWAAAAVPVPPPVETPPPAQQRAGQRRARRQALHQQVWALHHQGWTAPAIAQQVGLGLRTVQRDLRSPTFAGRKRRSDLGTSVLNPYKAYLLERWNAGCYTAMRLFRELQPQGYTGSYTRVAAYARRLRQAPGPP